MSLLQKAAHKRFRPTVVFVHQFGGNQGSSRRHRDWLCELGFDVYAFNLRAKYPPRWEFGLVRRWTKDIHQALDSIEGPKIIYSFSFPSASVARLLSTSPRGDVIGWISDGGPFIDLWTCQWNYFTHESEIRSSSIKFFGTLLSYFLSGGPMFPFRAKHWMRNLPKELPYLSLRSEFDRLVPEFAIEKLFVEARKTSTRASKILIPGVDHLHGLRDNPDFYRPQVEAFLTSIALEPPKRA